MSHISGVPDLRGLPSFEESCTQTISNEKVYTNVFLIDQQKGILLGLKKRGFGKGKWNGFGGKVEPNETIFEAAKREMKEEACINVTGLKKVGELKFVFTGSETALIAHIFTASDFEGTIQETEEMLPRWFPSQMEGIPFKEMWSDDHIWFPFLLKGKHFKGAFYFDGGDQKTLYGATLNPLDHDF